MKNPLKAYAKPQDPEQTVLNGDAEVVTRGITLTTLMVIVVVAAILHLGQEVFLPLAMAVLLTFALSPLVSFLRSRGLPHILSVLAAVFSAFAVIGLFMLISALQIGTLVQDLPSFQSNIVVKLDAFRDSGDGTGIVARLGEMFSSINEQIFSSVSDGSADPQSAADAANRPMPVEVIERQTALDVLSGLVVPLISPIATAGLVIVVVIFMLLEREEIRDRFIRLVGARDLHRTTEMLEEAGSRVANYLLIQLLVNVIYAIPIGVGLWLIGVPNALLWGMLTLVLRFVPYIGSILAAAFPLFLAFAVSPDWSAVLWTAALFMVVELITSNIIEPWLYGSRTGVSPLAIIVCAIFWTWVWGPLGLVLSTPLTVCLVVLGRHLPQFEVFDILFGDEPVLAPHSRLYQRLLAGDAVESAFRAEEALEEMYLAEYYRDVGIPALLLGQNDFERGVLTAAQEERLALAATKLVGDLAPIVDEELKDAAAAPSEPAKDADAAGRDGKTIPAPKIETEELDGVGFTILSIGGRHKLDDVAASMLAQTMAAEGATATQMSYVELSAARFANVVGTDAQCVILNFLDAAPSRASLLHVRRIKRAAPHLRVGIVMWEMPKALVDKENPLQLQIGRVPPEKITEADEIGSDFVVTNMADALEEAFRDEPARPPVASTAKARRSIASGRLRAVS